MNTNSVPPIDFSDMQKFIVVAIKNAEPVSEDRITHQFDQAADESELEYEPEVET